MKILTQLLCLLLVYGGLAVPMLVRPDEYSAELQLLFDPNAKHVIDDYGERPRPVPLPPRAGKPYEPNLDEEYY